jgi:site-specific DNA-methyltransferase (adenine-specific)
VAHIAGNVNGKTIRRFPVVTEVCGQYVRVVKLRTPDGQELPMAEWLRAEWMRTGLPFSKTNEACGVKNAATRKYFTKDHLWYYPPPEMMVRLAAFANEYGKPTKWPYFSLDGRSAVTAPAWVKLRAKWHHIHGVTNVWTEPAVRGNERLKQNGLKVLHANQKPIRLIDRIVRASSDAGDHVWEPFGGLCTAAIASLRSGRHCHSAEMNHDFYLLAKARLQREMDRLTHPTSYNLALMEGEE